MPSNRGEMDVISEDMGIAVTRCTVSYARNLPGVEKRDSCALEMTYQQH